MTLMTKDQFYERYKDRMPTETQHNNRNVGHNPQTLNGLPVTRSNLDRLAEDGWGGVRRAPASQSEFHQFGVPDKSNKKYIDGNGNEWVFDKNDNLITSGANAGSYNFGTSPLSFDHLNKDILPWILWGNGTGDTTTFEERYAFALRTGLDYFLDDDESDIPEEQVSPDNPIGTGSHVPDIEGRFTSAQTEASPLVLDLDGDGIELGNLNGAGTVFWDIDQDGVREETAWVASDDGFLALDRNDNGNIDGQAELFGSASEDGFLPLGMLDRNGDKRIDSLDPDFADLLVWRDLDADGISDSGELFDLASLGIVSISLDSHASTATIAGNRISSVSSYTLADGTSRQIVDAWLQYSNVVTRHDPGSQGYALASLLLPQLRGYGSLPSLAVAASLDATLLDMAVDLALRTTADIFDPAQDIGQAFEALMFRWAGAEGINAESRGRYIDAREVAFLEALVGNTFTQRGNPNPAVEASATLHNAFIDAQNALLFRFLAQSGIGSLFNNLGSYDFNADEFSGTPSLNMAKVAELTGAWHYSGQTLLTAWSNLFRVIEGGIGLDHLSNSDKTALNALIDQSDTVGSLDFDDVVAAIFPNEGLGLNGTNGVDNLVGGAGNDTLDAGSGNDTASGRQGHDWIDGGAGDDTLNGEEGDDTLLGGSGNDTYAYTSGLDTIRDTSGTDSIQFGAGVTLANLSIKISPTNEGDAQIYINGVLSLIVEDMFTTSGGIESFRFADGSSFNAGALITPKNGTSGNDTLTGSDAAIFPHDYLYGQNGDDRLIGGVGDDRLFGGSGNDTYVVAAGADRIQDSGGAADRIEFGAGYVQANMLLARAGNDLVISFQGVNAATVYGQFDGSGTIEQLVFAGGGTFDLLSVRYALDGTTGRDTLYGVDTGGGGDIIHGLGGDDRIYAYAGDDEIDGGAGDDYLDGGTGNDRYIRSAGYDVIRDGGGTDVIDLGAVDPSRVTLIRSDSDLIVAVDGVAAIYIDNQFTQYGQIESIRANGQTIDLLARSYVITGGSQSETIYGISYGGSPDDRIHGNEGNDRIYGQIGNDLLDGGDGDDALSGGAGNDSYYVGSGWNSISEDGLTTDVDTVFLPDGVNPGDVTLGWIGSGDLAIRWNGGGVVIDNAYSGYDTVELLTFANGVSWSLLAIVVPVSGGGADDSLGGNDGNLGPHNDQLFGNGGDDRLYGYDGADLLDGGAGDDELYGSTGADVYRPGQGDNYIADAGATNDGADRVILPAGVALADVTFYRLGDRDLLLTWSGGSVRIDDGLDRNSAIETLETATGATLSLPAQNFVTIGSDVGDSLGGNDQELGSRNDDIRGNGGDDRLDGYDGNDRLEGGAGDDDMYGGAGADSYYVGPGNDYVDEAGLSADAADRIYLPTGVVPAGVTIWREYDGDLTIQWAGGSVRIDNAYDLTSAVEELRFADGTVWNLTQRAVETIGSGESGSIGGNREELGSRDDIIRGLGGDDDVFGYDGNDMLDGGSGDDELYGSTGGDTYIVGYGWDYVEDAGAAGDAADTVKIGRSDLRLADLSFARLSNNDIRISWAGGAEGVVIYRGLTGNNTIEFLELADGTRVSLAAQTFANVTIPANQSLSGDATANTITGGDGNDTLTGNDGNDILEGAGGNDNMYGGNGADTYRVGQGRDFLQDSGRATDGADRIVMTVDVTAAALTFARLADGDLLASWTGGSFRIDAAFDLNRAIETLALKDGTVIDLATVAFATIGTTGAETLEGNQEELGSRNDDIRGLDGNDALYGYDGDDRLDGGAGDDALYGNIGNDTYVVQGNDGIVDTGGADRILLPTGVTAAMLSFVRDDDGTLLISWAGGSVAIDSAYDLARAVETLVFADGSTLNLTAQSFETRGTAAGESLDGNREELGSRDDVVRGLGGDDSIYGYDGNDTLDGGVGDDALYGAAGADRYIVSGHDYVGDDGATGDAADRIVLPAGVNLADLSLTRLGNGDLLLAWGSQSVQIYRGLEARYAVELIQFGDGSTTSLTALPFTTRGTDASETIYGNEEAIGSHADTIFGADGDDALRGRDGNDRLVGGLGDDALYGDGGADTYVLGEGDDYISEFSSNTADGPDTIELPAGITLAGLTAFRLDNGNLVLDWGIGSVQIEDGLDRNSAVEQIRFADGTLVQVASLVLETRGSGENETLRGNVEELGSRNDVIRAMGGNDRLYGYDGDDLLDSGGGDDQAYGGAGNDIYLAGQGADMFVEGFDGSGSDTLRFAADADIGTLAVHRLGNDLELRWGGNSILLDEHFRGGGYAFESVQFGSRAVASLGLLLNLSAVGATAAGTATTGDDTLVGTADANQLSGLAGSDLILGGDGGDGIDGGDGADLLYGGAGIDAIAGGAGDDRIDGGTGIDQLSGGSGNDLFLADSQGDLVFEKAGEGTDTVIASASYYLYANIENLTLVAGTGDIFGVGNELANTVLGNEGSNLLIAGAGNDLVRGGAGIDSLFGEDGADQLFGDLGIDYLVGGGGDDMLDGGFSADALYGEDGNDTLWGGSDFRTDILVGGAGNDVLRADSGLADYDLIDGGAGSDSYYVDTGDDLTFEAAGGGTDTVYANVGGANNGVYLYANVENLVLLNTTAFGVGNELANTMTGSASGNWLLGGAGNDVLNGKAGNDVLFGETGADRFVFEAGTGGDVIGDFQAGTDKIDLSAFGFTSFAQVQAAMVENGGTTAINLGGGDLIVLNGVANAALHASDFVLSASNRPVDEAPLPAVAVPAVLSFTLDEPARIRGFEVPWLYLHSNGDDWSASLP